MSLKETIWKSIEKDFNEQVAPQLNELKKTARTIPMVLR